MLFQHININSYTIIIIYAIICIINIFISILRVQLIKINVNRYRKKK